MDKVLLCRESPFTHGNSRIQKMPVGVWLSRAYPYPLFMPCNRVFCALLTWFTDFQTVRSLKPVCRCPVFIGRSGTGFVAVRSLKPGAGLVIPSRRGFRMGLSPVYVIADSPCVPSGGRKALPAPTAEVHTGAEFLIACGGQAFRLPPHGSASCYAVGGFLLGGNLTAWLLVVPCG